MSTRIRETCDSQPLISDSDGPRDCRNEGESGDEKADERQPTHERRKRFLQAIRITSCSSELVSGRHTLGRPHLGCATCRIRDQEQEAARLQQLQQLEDRRRLQQLQHLAVLLSGSRISPLVVGSDHWNALKMVKMKAAVTRCTKYALETVLWGRFRSRLGLKLKLRQIKTLHNGKMKPL